MSVDHAEDTDTSVLSELDFDHRLPCEAVNAYVVRFLRFRWMWGPNRPCRKKGCWAGISLCCLDSLVVCDHHRKNGRAWLCSRCGTITEITCWKALS